MVALNERWLTRGSDGVSGIPAPFRVALGTESFNLFYLALVSVFVLGIFLMLNRLDGSPFAGS